MMKKLTLAILITLNLVATFCEYAQAETYYVSPTGTASWGSAVNIATPCSASTAMSQAVAGDIVYFLGGTYDPGEAPNGYTPALNPSNSGTAVNPITFAANPGEIVNITGTGTGASFGVYSRDYIIWDGFTGTAVNKSDDGETFYAGLWSTTGSKMRNCNFSGFDFDEHTNKSVIRVEDATNCEVYNNRISGMTGDGVNTCGIWVFESTNLNVYHNNIYNCANGIMQKTGANVGNSYYRNLIYNTSYCGIFLNEQVGGSGCKVYQNVLVDTATSGYAAITLAAVLQATDYEIYNNTIYGSDVGIMIDNDAVMAPYIWNNLIVNTGTLFHFYTGVYLPTYCDYNGFYDSSLHWNTNWTNDYYTLESWSSATGLDANSVTSDPGFVNPGGTAASDYKRSSYATNGRGGTYASVMGAWLSDSSPTQIGYVAQANATIVTSGGKIITHGGKIVTH